MGQAAVVALTENSRGTLTVWITIKVHKTLIKAGLEAQAAAFKVKGLEIFPLATYWTTA